MDDKGWWVLEPNSQNRILTPVDDIKVKYSDNKKFEEILERINWFSPMWNRWVANADQYELLKREALTYVVKIMAGLSFFEIKNTIFHTGISHHIDNSLIEIACSKQSIPQIFLHSNVINGRLLPLIQRNSIDDVVEFGKKISKYDASEDINNFFINKLKNKEPKTAYAISLMDKKANYGRYRLLYDAIKSFFVKKIKYFLGRSIKEVVSILNEKPLGITDHFRLIRQQEEALDFYLKNCMSVEEIQELENKTSIPLVTAHFQPEATSFPMGGNWGNHVDIVLRMRNLKCTGDIIYKEHPASWIYYEGIVGMSRVGLCRSISYYQQLLDLGCKFLPPDYKLNIQPLVNSWYLPVTITGTISVERSLFGLPSIYSGNPIYKGLPGTYSMDEITDFNDFLENIQRPGLINQDDVIQNLSNQLSFTTITNILGIGTGVPLDDEELLNTFNAEYKSLINNLD